MGIPGERTSARLTIGSITSGKVAEVTLELKLKKLSGASKKAQNRSFKRICNRLMPSQKVKGSQGNMNKYCI